MNRRSTLKGLAVAALGLPVFSALAAVPVVRVYKSAGCGCCEEWIKHMEANGFTVKSQDVADTSVYRKRFGIPQELGSCHTAVVDGYALEGHVPAREVKRLLAEKPNAAGLSVPGMPLGSPGMEGPRKDSYDVFLVLKSGDRSVYSHYD